MKVESSLLWLLLILSLSACTGEKPEPILGKWHQFGSNEPQKSSIEFLPNSVLIRTYKVFEGIESSMGEWKKVSDSQYVLSFSIGEIPLVVKWEDVEFTSDTSLSVSINEESYTFYKID